MSYLCYLTIILQKISYPSVWEKGIKVHNFQNNLPNATLIWAKYVKPREFVHLLAQKLSSNNPIDIANRVKLVEGLGVTNEFSKSIVIEEKKRAA